jgi:hypothetical protein
MSFTRSGSLHFCATPRVRRAPLRTSPTTCAYEFKVSGKNAWAEFYKDVVKVLMWNQHRKKKLSCLTFITEEKFGKPFLDAPMPRAYVRYLADQGLKVSIAYVRHG